MSEEQQEAPPSQILVSFLAPGASEFNIQMQGVSPNQLLCLSAWLEWKARNLLDTLEERRAMNQIAVPSGPMPGGGLVDPRGRPS